MDDMGRPILISPDSLLSMKWMLEEPDVTATTDYANLLAMSQAEHTSCHADSKTMWTYSALTMPYISTEDTKLEVAKMKINPKEFKYDGYSRYEDSGRLTEDEARDNMTDYYYTNSDPLIFRKVRKHYYLAGPDAETSPTKRKFYNALSWYKDFYDGRHGQTTDIEVEEIDLNDWDELIIAMVVSGDFTLREAMYAVANACDRCRHALLYKYKDLHTRTDGYSEESDEYQKNSYRCNFCRY